jgi:hypothetical protein
VQLTRSILIQVGGTVARSVESRNFRIIRARACARVLERARARAHARATQVALLIYPNFGVTHAANNQDLPTSTCVVRLKRPP